MRHSPIDKRARRTVPRQAVSELNVHKDAPADESWRDYLNRWIEPEILELLQNEARTK